MSQCYRAILRGDRLEWLEASPWRERSDGAGMAALEEVAASST